MSNRLQILHNRAARSITHSDYDRRSSEILYELEWDDLEKRRRKQPAIIIIIIVSPLRSSSFVPRQLTLLTFAAYHVSPSLLKF